MKQPDREERDWEPEEPSEAASGPSIDPLLAAFGDQLLACLSECARGRRGLFAAQVLFGGEEEKSWPEAERLRELAMALQAMLAQEGDRNALCEEFLDLCTMHGESHPGEARLARSFLQRIERGEVGTGNEALPW